MLKLQLKSQAFLKRGLSFVLALQLAAPLPVFAQQTALVPTGTLQGQKSNKMQLSEAVDAFKEYDGMKLSVLLGPADAPLTAEKIHRVDVVWAKLARASYAMDILPNTGGYLSWWAQNKMEMLANREKAGDVTALNFFHQTLQIYMAEKTGAAENPYAYMKWHERLLSNPWIKTSTAVMVTGSIATIAFIAGIVKGALVAGPAASMVSAFVEPYVRRPRDRVRLAGERFKRFTDITVVAPVKNVMKRVRPQTSVLEDVGIEEADLEKNDRHLSDSTRAVVEARRQISGMGYGLSGAEYTKFMETTIGKWRAAYGSWLQTIPEIDRTSRSTYSDLSRFRPQQFAHLVTQNVQAAEQYIQGAEGVRRDIIAENPDKRGEIKDIVQSLQALNEEVVRTETYEPEKLETVEQHIQEASERLATLGAEDAQIKRLNKNFRFAAKMQMAAAYNLAVHIQHEIEYEEFNRSLPKDLAAQVAEVRESLGLDFFHREFRTQVIAQLDMMGLKVAAHEGGAETFRKNLAERRAKKAERQKRFERALGSGEGPGGNGTSAAERERAEKKNGERNMLRDAVRSVRKK